MRLVAGAVDFKALMTIKLVPKAYRTTVLAIVVSKEFIPDAHDSWKSNMSHTLQANIELGHPNGSSSASYHESGGNFMDRLWVRFLSRMQKWAIGTYEEDKFEGQLLQSTKSIPRHTNRSADLVQSKTTHWDTLDSRRFLHPMPHFMSAAGFLTFARACCC